MEYLPLFVDLKNRPVLIVGGGDVAFRKIIMLHKSGAIIKIVTDKLCLELKKFLSMHDKISWIASGFHPVMLKSVILVIVATNDINLNNIVYKSAEEYHVLINSVDDQDRCSCIFPAIVDRDPILIGISSCGKAPVLVRILRERFESILPTSLGLLANFVGTWRARVKKYIKDLMCRRRFWEKIFYDGQLAILVEQKRFREANRLLKNSLSNSNNYNKKGIVTLVGAGPGDRELLTIKGLQAIQQADIILYDYLINTDILEFARRDANKICVGKRMGKHLMSQKDINDLLIQLANVGNKVVRLKGGDPFVFGRGGEELQALSKLNIPFQVIPGITAGLGVTAYAGIPVTHRKYAHSVTFITGHFFGTDKLNWNILSDNRQTIIVYMGSVNSLNISKNLILHGRDMHTPVAVISRGTYPDQKILIGTLTELNRLTSLSNSPMLLVIGYVVSFSEIISWYKYHK